MQKKIKFHIDHLDPLAQGVYKSEKDIYFISKTLPGETGTAIVTDHKKNIHFAYPENVKESSLNRITPPCPHYHDCSSCHYMHTTYAQEMLFKTQALHKHLQKIDCPKHQIFIHEAANRFYYRNRIQLHYDLTQAKLGIISRHLNDIISIPNCLLLSESITTQVKSLYEMPLSEIIDASKHPSYGHLEISCNQTCKIFINQPYSAEGFCQVNDQQNDVLLNLLSKASTQYLKKDSIVMDLFGGNGNLSSKLLAQQIYIFDIYKKVPVGNYKQTFYSQDLYAFDAINKLVDICHNPDLLILDPPRSGFKELSLLVKRIKPDIIFYVSCNPATLARDLSSLSDYAVLEIHLIDFFPSTYHFETFCILSKK